MSVNANPYHLRYTAQHFSMGAVELRDKANRLRASKAHLTEGHGAWIGDGAGSFSAQSQQYEEKIRRAAVSLESSANTLSVLANQMERVIELRNRAGQLEMESYEVGGDSIDDLHRRQSLLHQAHQLRQEADWESNVADSQAEHSFRAIMAEIQAIEVWDSGATHHTGNGNFDDLPEPLRSYYSRHSELFKEDQDSTDKIDNSSTDEAWYEEAWDWLKGQGREFVTEYKKHWTTGNIWYDEANYWTLGIPDKITRVFHTKPFSWDNLVANLDLFVSVVPATKAESGFVDAVKGAEIFRSTSKATDKIGTEALTEEIGIAISEADRLKLSKWKYRPSDELYIKYKKVFDNPKYYDQSTGDIKWPINDGFEGIAEAITLKPGTRIDRYGFESGTFVSPEGIPYEMRSLAPGTSNKPYHIYEVLKPIDGLGGKIAPWFDEVGGGMQYKLTKTIQELIDEGYLRGVFD